MKKDDKGMNIAKGEMIGVFKVFQIPGTEHPVRRKGFPGFFGISAQNFGQVFNFDFFLH
jgi:hypothetical protein